MICLNMIVKNEKHIIGETLDNLCKYIDFGYWVISDTGSTDGTQEYIKTYFDNKGIKGELFEDEWVDFASNRNKVMEHAFNKSDYLFFFDADDLIQGDFKLPSVLDKDVYYLKFSNYERICLINNREKIARYEGVLHECLIILKSNHSSMYVDGDYFFVCRHLGDRSKTPNLYKKDAEILALAYENETENKLKNRYCFYCAKSYSECGMIEESIQWYEKFLTLDADNQHKYCTCMNLGMLYPDKSLYYYELSCKYDPTRIEGITRLMEHYYNKKLHNTVNALWNKFKDYTVFRCQNKLFLDESVYARFEWFNIVSGYYANDHNGAYESCKRSIKNNFNIPNVLQNLILYKTQFDSDSDNEVVNNFLITHVTNDRYNLFFKKPQNIIKSTEFKKSNKILFYTGIMNFLWNDSTLKEQSLGGSEKAVIYLTRHLPKSYDIYVAGDHVEEEVDNIKYIHNSNVQNLLDENEFDTIIVSRYISFFEQFNNIKCNKLMVWCHDSQINGNISTLKTYYDYIDHIVCLTNWHGDRYLSMYKFIEKSKIEIINNGINIEDFKQTNSLKIKNKFVWTSDSVRGLLTLVKMWPNILEELPGATLDISSYNTFPLRDCDNEILNVINTYPNSIKHHGKLDTKRLYDLMSKAEYWLYTTNFAETSCITAMEMLMNNVICLYYPLAGLNDTLGDYGIKVESGKEIETIIGLSEKNKREIIENGHTYALSCTWENRAQKWCKLLGFCNNKKIGIFNSFHFHYEVFGYILNYAKNNDYMVDIYTNTSHDMGWFDFYYKQFNNFIIKDFKSYDGDSSRYDLFFLTTDDDPKFDSKCIRDNVVCINHYNKIRSKGYKHYLNIANFSNSVLDSIFPCYSIVETLCKKQNNTVSIVGGSEIYDDNTIKIINRLYSTNKIKLNIICRNNRNYNFSGLNVDKFEISCIKNVLTMDMINILKKSSYILVDYCTSHDRLNGMSCSASIALALSTLCKPIISNKSNIHWKIKNALEFDIENNDPIILDTHVDFDSIQQEQTLYVDKFEKYCNTSLINSKFPKIMFQTWETYDIEPEFQNIINLWKKHNPEYTYVFHDRNERRDFIKDNFDENVLKTYDKILPGGAKCDLWKYCILYIHGGFSFDLDTLCMGKIDDLIHDGTDFIVPVDLNINPAEGEHNLAPGFIGSVPGHPIFIEAINIIVRNVLNNTLPPSRLDFTGPGVLGRAVNIYIKRDETSSFKNKEGIRNNINFLHFDPETEYITDVSNNTIILQNKNKNHDIIRLYNIECNKIKEFKCWVTSKDLIAK